MTTRITRRQIEDLRVEAGAAGDEAMVEICRRAEEGDREAIAECERVIAYARAQDVAVAGPEGPMEKTMSITTEEQARVAVSVRYGIEFGVERLSLPTGEEIRYVNIGDPYVETLISHDEGETWIWECWGDVFEAAEREHVDPPSSSRPCKVSEEGVSEE